MGGENVTQDIQLLNQIYQNAQMGRDGIHNVLDQVEDEGLHAALERQMQGYQKTFDTAGQMLEKKGEKPKGTGFMVQTMSHAATDWELNMDGSNSHIADMIIQGSTMGITKMTQRLHEYDGQENEIVALARAEIKKEQKNIEEMKKYL